MIRTGLAAARWPGRLERRRFRGRELLLDGAHNPPAAAALRRELDRLDGGLPRRWLLGIQRHKAGPAMLELLLRPGDQASIVAVPEHASWSLRELAGACPALAHQLQEAAGLAAALEELRAPGPLPVVAGSLFLLGATIPMLDAPQADAAVPLGQPGDMPGRRDP
jgi:dihydrofolate synthase/folylpolyglutamate synthase